MSSKARLTSLFCVALCLLFFLAGCSSRAKLTLTGKNLAIQRVAILPLKIPAGINRERAIAVYEAVTVELRNKNYVVLDRQVVNEVCGVENKAGGEQGGCASTAKLFSGYGVDAVFNLELRSVTKADFVAGYYNTVAGNLRCLDRENREIFSIDHQESERGGLVFNSGQVLQGVISQYQNSGDAGFQVLAEKFASAVVTALPNSTAQVASDSIAVKLDEISVRNMKGGLYEICAIGTPRARAALVYGGSRSNLREGKDGVYCGLYFLERLPTAEVAIELRSPFGVSSKKTATALKINNCALPEKASIAVERREGLPTFRCAVANAGNTVCTVESTGCEKFVVYRNAGQEDIYAKVGEFVSSASWMERARHMADGRYQIVGVDLTGNRSQPFEVSSASR